MKTYVQLAFLILLVAIYLFFFLGIELDLKYVLESPGVNTDRLVDTASHIRKFQTIQLALFAAVCALCTYHLFKKK